MGIWIWAHGMPGHGTKVCNLLLNIWWLLGYRSVALLWEQLKPLTCTAVFVFPHCSEGWLWEAVKMEVEHCSIKWKVLTKARTSEPGYLSSKLLNSAPHRLPNPSPPLPHQAERFMSHTRKAAPFLKALTSQGKGDGSQSRALSLGGAAQHGNDGRGGNGNSITRTSYAI